MRKAKVKAKVKKPESLFAQVIKLVQSDKWYAISPEVEIAKGKFEIVSDHRGFIAQAKRILMRKGVK